MLVDGEVADVDGAKRPSAVGKRLAGKAQAQRPGEHLGEEGEHGGAPSPGHTATAPSLAPVARSSLRSQVCSCPMPFTWIGPRGSNPKLSPSTFLTSSET